MAVCLFIIGLGISELRFTENIVDVLPQDERLSELSETIENLKVNDQIVVLVSQEEGEPEELISFADILLDSIRTEQTDLLSGITYEIGNDRLTDLYSFYAENIPFYLTESDYDRLESRMNADSLDALVGRVYRAMISPMGIFGSKFLMSDPFGLVGEQLKRAQELKMDDNITLFQNRFVSQDQRSTMFFLRTANPASETERNGQLVDLLDRIQSNLESTHPDKTISCFGSPAMAVANARQIKRDVQVTVSLALIFLLAFIGLYYRNLIAFFKALLPGLFGALLALGVLGFFRDGISIISLAIGSVLLGITIDYALHYLTHAKFAESQKDLFKELGFPTLVCALTSASAFGALLFIRASAMQDLGLFAGVSVLGASLFTLLVFPHIVSVGGGESETSSKENIVEKAIHALSSFRIHNKKWALTAVVVISVLCLIKWNDVSFQEDMLKLNYTSPKLAESERRINEVSDFVSGNVFGSVSDSSISSLLGQNLRFSQTLDSLEREGAILDYVNINKIIPDIQVQKERLTRWNAFWTSHDRDGLIESLNSRAEEMGFVEGAFSEFQTLLSREYTSISEASMEKVCAVFGEDLLSRYGDKYAALTAIKVDQSEKKKIAAFFSAQPGIQILDQASIASQLVSLLNEDFSRLVSYSLLIVFMILLVAYGRIEMALLSFIPIGLSWLWVLGIMGWLDLQFNVVNVIVCTFIFGIGIDYSIFLLHGQIEKYKTDRGSLSRSKRSILLSTITTIAGLGVLIFAKHPAIKSIAVLTLVGIFSVIVITFIVQPFLFNLFIGTRKKKGQIPFTFQSAVISLIAFSYFFCGCILLFVLRFLFYLPLGSLKFRKRIFHHVIRAFCWSLMYIMVKLPKKVIDREKMDFSRPSVIISNHHSFIDILFLLSLDHRIVMVTNSWVFNSPFFGKSIQFADFIHAADGLDDQKEHIQSLIDDGYSIMVFPEGSRSASSKLRRFHKGAFYLAQEFGLDIQPIILHGTSWALPKGDDFHLKNNGVSVKFLDRVSFNDKSFGETYSERAKSISRHFKKAYQQHKESVEIPSYFNEWIRYNFTFKGPILEWYYRIKTRLEGRYDFFHELVPREARIMDLGCGYGFMSYALAMSSDQRMITSIDYDADKVNIASSCPNVPSNLSFASGDVMKYPFEESDVFILSDVLHYLTKNEQKELMNKMLNSLSANGQIILRDGDAEKENRQKGTALTEFFSTNFGFNKTRNDLNFITRNFVEDFAQEHHLNLKVIDHTKYTSNLIFVLKKM